jgi:hypothetical protein
MGIDDGEAIVSCERDHRWQAAIGASSQIPVKIKQEENWRIVQMQRVAEEPAVWRVKQYCEIEVFITVTTLPAGF